MERQPIIGTRFKTMPPALTELGRRYLVGLGLLLGVVLLWTISNFITAALETGEDQWEKPFLITYLNTSSFTLYLIPRLWRHSYPLPSSYEPLESNAEVDAEQTARSASSSSSPSPRSDHGKPLDPRYAPSYLAHARRLSERLDELVLLSAPTSGPSAEEQLSVGEIAKIAAWWSLLWFIANWALTASLAWTSVASVTILSSTSGFFTLALGRMCGVETIDRTKIFAAIASFIGVFLVTRSDSTISTSSENLPTHPILGDCLALVSAACYAMYTVFLKVRVGNEDRADMKLMLGFAGLFNTIGLLPIFPLLHISGLETFSLPPSRSAWIIIGINMCITVSSDYLYVLAMLKTTPVLVTIGFSLTIPLALAASLFVSAGGSAITALSLGGAGLVLLGFVILGIQGWEESTATPVNEE